MNLTKAQIDAINVEVDRYTVNPSTEKIGCECIIADQEEYNTVVTYDELREYADADDNGMVEIVWSNDDEPSKIHFSEWMQDHINMGTLREPLEYCVNKREGRTALALILKDNPFEDIKDMIDGMIN